MQGDLNVDLLMLPVLHAIERHVKDRDAITDIYNRAYEAVMTSMDVKTGKTYCAYCGAEYPLDDDAATLVSEHIKTCEKHPMRAVEAEIARLTAELATANEDAALPDYNPNGTANPKGDAAYWRTRAESAETKVSEYAKALLLVEMRIISEEAYCAGWMLGLEWACMDIVAGRISNYGLLADFDLHKRTLEELHKFAGGWWMWRDGDQEETFVLDANIVNYKVERR